MENKTSLLLLESDAARLDGLREVFSRLDGGKYQVNAFLYFCAPEVCSERDFDLVVFSLKNVLSHDLEVIDNLRASGLKAPVMMLLKEKNPKLELVARESGVDDFLYRGELEPHFLDRSIQFALERKRAAEKVRESEERYRTLIRSSPVGIWHINRQGNTIYMNQVMREMVEVDDWKKLKNETYHRFFTEEGLKTIDEENSKREKGIISSYEATLLGEKGGVREVMISGGPLIGTDGQFHGIIGTFTDITERKKAELQLWEAKEKAEEATKLKDKFVSLVAHDLRGPLGTMVTFLEMARKTADGDEKLTKYLSSSLKLGRNMAALIENLLNVSRFATGKMKPVKKFFSGRIVILKALSELEFPAQTKGIELVKELPERVRLFGDPALVAEVLKNLLSNAIKFCDKGDRITISMTMDDEASISVTDTGVGISDVMIKKIFSFEEHTSTPGTAGESGTGLGLPLCRDIMRAHGGDLTAESEKGKGSVFTASLPVVRPVVMVIAADADLQERLTGYLKEEELDVITTGGVEETLKISTTIKPHLVILDFAVPGGEVGAFIEELRLNADFRAVPVLALTDDEETYSRRQVIEAGADDFMPKPVKRADLFARLRTHLG